MPTTIASELHSNGLVIVQNHPKFESQINGDWPIDRWCDVTVLLAVSGGADSVAMLRALQRIHVRAQGSGSIVVAHFNHRWRAAESDLDESFVLELCERLNLVCQVGRSTHAKKNEAAARDDRYRFLQQTAERRGARYLVTAHTADDQAETVLHRILRGTGLRGLTGIRKSRLIHEAVTLCRPMLSIRRRDVEAYLKQIGQTFRNDLSNQDCGYTRNRLRQDLMPQLRRDYNASLTDSLCKLATLAGEAEDYVQRETESALQRCLFNQSTEWVELRTAEFNACPSFLRRQLLVLLWQQQHWPQQAMDFEAWHRLEQAIVAGEHTTLPGAVRVDSAGRVTRIGRN